MVLFAQLAHIVLSVSVNVSRLYFALYFSIVFVVF